MRVIIVAVFVLPICACRGIVRWGTVYSLRASDGDAQVLVQEKGCFADCAVQVVVKRGWSAEQIAWKSDCIINFAHAEWSGGVVAVFVDGGYCGPIKVAYDITSRQSVDFKITEQWLKPAIIKTYGVTSDELLANGGDVLVWATYPGDGNPRRSMDEFHRRYPDP